MQRVLFLAFVFALTNVPSTPAAEKRYTVKFSDGSSVDADTWTGWLDGKDEPAINGRKLYDPKNSAVWYRDNNHRLIQPAPPFVEFHGGDVLPGKILGGERNARGDADLLVESNHFNRGMYDNGRIRVVPEFIRRVVFTTTPPRTYEPGVAYAKDGRSLRFRSARFVDKNVQLLTENDLLRFEISDLLEIHFPNMDLIEQHSRMLAHLASGIDDTLIEIHTSSGLRATLSRARLQRLKTTALSVLFLFARPAWCREMLQLSMNEVSLMRFLPVDVIPLTSARPSRVKEVSLLGTPWPWRLNANVHRRPFTGSPSPVGFGVHAYAALQFPLPPEAEEFLVTAKLDESAANGGCVRAQLFVSNDPAADPTGKPLYQSDPIIGSDNPVEIAVSLVATQKPRWLWLVADPLATTYPQGADPLDIGDHLNWFEPRLKLDRAKLRERVSQLALERIAHFRGWQITNPSPGASVSDVWTGDNGTQPNIRTFVQPGPAGLTLTRTFTVTPAERWLYIQTYGLDHTKPADVSFEVRVNGKPIEPSHENYNQHFVPLHAFLNQEVKLQIYQPHAADKKGLQWGRLSFWSYFPHRRPIFDEGFDRSTVLTEGERHARIVTNDSFLGRSSLKVAAGGAVRISNINAKLATTPLAGEYRYFHIAWKSSGQPMQFDLHFRDPVQGDKPLGRRKVSYFHGANPPKDTLHINAAATGIDGWNVLTRDFASDVSPWSHTLQLTDIVLKSNDAETFFDGIFLGTNELEFANVRRQFVRDGPDSVEFVKVFSSIAPGFMPKPISSTFMSHVREHFGRTEVLRMHHVDPKVNLILERKVSLPAGGKPRLLLSVARDERLQATWELTVRAKGITLYQGAIDAKSAPQGWADIEVDLKAFAGMDNVLLELQQQPKHPQLRFAYYGKVELVEK